MYQFGIVEMSARRTGRTTLLVDSLKDGDRVVFINGAEAQRVGRLIKERGLNVQCVVIDPRTPEELFELGTPEGRSIFDHTWVHEFFTIAVDGAADKLDYLQTQGSGYGEAHRRTLRKAELLSALATMPGWEKLDKD